MSAVKQRLISVQPFPSSWNTCWAITPHIWLFHFMIIISKLSRILTAVLSNGFKWFWIPVFCDSFMKYKLVYLYLDFLDSNTIFIKSQYEDAIFSETKKCLWCCRWWRFITFCINEWLHGWWSAITSKWNKQWTLEIDYPISTTEYHPLWSPVPQC